MGFPSVVRAFVATALVVVTLGLSACVSTAVTVNDRDPDALRVAFYGDSYTRGSGATVQGLRWSTLLSEERGWSEFNPSVSGLGFARNREIVGDGDLPSLIIADDPDVVIVTLGLNDNFTYESQAEEIRTNILSDFTRLSTGLPDARLIVVEPFWFKEERPASVDIIISWVRESANAVGAEYIPGASYWLPGHPEWMASDDLHPNDEGHAVIASQMDRALRALRL